MWSYRCINETFLVLKKNSTKYMACTKEIKFDFNLCKNDIKYILQA